MIFPESMRVEFAMRSIRGAIKVREHRIKMIKEMGDPDLLGTYHGPQKFLDKLILGLNDFQLGARLGRLHNVAKDEEKYKSQLEEARILTFPWYAFGDELFMLGYAKSRPISFTKAQASRIFFKLFPRKEEGELKDAT